MSIEAWQTTFDSEYPDGVRVEYQPEAWDDDPDNKVFYSVRVMVDAVNKDDSPAFTVWDIYAGNGDHRFVTVSPEPVTYGRAFSVEVGRVLLTPHVPPGIKADIDRIREMGLVEYMDPHAEELTA